MKTYWGVEAQHHTFLTSVLYGSEWSASRPGRFTPEEITPGTHCTGGRVGPNLYVSRSSYTKSNLVSDKMFSSQ